MITTWTRRMNKNWKFTEKSSSKDSRNHQESDKQAIDFSGNFVADSFVVWQNVFISDVGSRLSLGRSQHHTMTKKSLRDEICCARYTMRECTLPLPRRKDNCQTFASIVSRECNSTGSKLLLELDRIFFVVISNFCHLQDDPWLLVQWCDNFVASKNIILTCSYTSGCFSKKKEF